MGILPLFSLHLSLTGAGSIPPTQTLQGVSNRGGAETAAGDGGGIGVGSTAAVLGVRRCVRAGQSIQVPGMPHVPG